MEPDDYAYRASIVALTDGHRLTLSTAQVTAPAAQLNLVAGPGGAVSASPGPLGSIEQWVQLPDGRWISEKDPGYPFLAAPFQLLGIIRLAPLFYGALACLGLFFGARRWLGRYGGTARSGCFATACRSVGCNVSKDVKMCLDDVLGGELAVAHLLESGHTQIAFVGGPLSIRQVADRRGGVLRALDRAEPRRPRRPPVGVSADRG